MTVLSKQDLEVILEDLCAVHTSELKFFVDGKADRDELDDVEQSLANRAITMDKIAALLKQSM